MEVSVFEFYVYLGAFVCTLLTLAIMMVLTEDSGHEAIKVERLEKRVLKKLSAMKEMT